MAIPATPTGFNLQTGNRQNLLTWNITTGATSYAIKRSLDGITYSAYATATLPSYTDTSVSAGTEYWYEVAAVNGSGTSIYTAPISIIPAPTGEMSLRQVREMSQQKADRVNSEFVTLPEWNNFINLAMYELYDLLITSYEDYFSATPAQFTSDGTTYLYPLPDGVTSFTNGITGQAGLVAAPFYKLMGVDLGVQTANNAWVTLYKFNFNERNTYVYPNSNSTIYGVYNLRYRLVGNNIEFIPVPSANQPIRLWYVPRLPTLLKDTDLTTIGFSGWLEYVIARAAKYALDKEESDTTKLDQELLYIKSRIEETSQNRDQGAPDRITDVRQTGYFGGSGYFGNSPIGGF